MSEAERPPSASSKPSGEYMSLSERYPSGMPKHVVGGEGTPAVDDEPTDADVDAVESAEAAKEEMPEGEDVTLEHVRSMLINYTVAHYADYLEKKDRDSTAMDSMFRFQVADILVNVFSAPEDDYPELIVELGKQEYDDRRSAGTEGSDA